MTIKNSLTNKTIIHLNTQSLSLSLSLSLTSEAFSFAFFEKLTLRAGVTFLLRHFIQSDTNRSNPVPNCVASPYVGKASKDTVMIADSFAEKKLSDLLSISPTFYEQLLRQNPFAKIYKHKL